jgi:serine/threonine-protein kinase
MLGSPVYMAPEQLRNAKFVDTRADIWSLGVVLYELLTGRLPFHAENVAELCVAVLKHAPPPLRSWRAELAPQLEEIVMRCLSQDVEQRFQDVADLAAALAPFGHSSAPLSVKRIRHLVQTAADWTAPATRSEPAPRRRRRVVAVVAALAIGAAATASLLAHGPALSTAPAAQTRGR